MQNNNIYKMQQYFFEYINTSDILKKQAIIEKCQEDLKSESIIIARLKNIVDNLSNNPNTLKSFINNVFDIHNDNIRLDLIENLESQINNKTVYNMSQIQTKLFTIISYENFVKENIEKNFEIINSNTILFNSEEKLLIPYKTEDTFFNNYLVEKIFGFVTNDAYIAYNENNKYVIASSLLPQMSESKILKEESLCETRDIQYFIDRIIGENENKEMYLKRIFIDLLTNQNYRILNEGFGYMNSDLMQNEYYVLNGVTLKKNATILSFLKNYYSDVESITNLIYDNYELILKTIEQIDCNSTYKQYLIENIKYTYEQLKIKNSLTAIETGEDLQVYTDSRNDSNHVFENNLQKLSMSLNREVMKLSNKKGYSSIYLLIFSIILSGMTIAYLILKL